MPSTRFTVHTSLSPHEVLELFTDFGPGRADRWPNVDAAHFEVHCFRQVDVASVPESDPLESSFGQLWSALPELPDPPLPASSLAAGDPLALG